MVLPVIAYGDPVLRKKAQEIEKDHPGLEKLIADMFDTMYYAHGVGLAAPQIGESIRLFIVDGKPFEEDEPALGKFRKVFINAEILEESGEKWAFNEGCLSIPKIREDVSRNSNLRIRYVDENFVEQEESYEGLAARIIQHEYDHIEGKLFVDYLTPLKKRMLEGALDKISKGIVSVDYKMKFPRKKGR